MQRLLPCLICGFELVRGWRMCITCCKSYDRHAYEDESVMGAMVWAAGRARRGEKKRARQKAKPRIEKE